MIRMPLILTLMAACSGDDDGVDLPTVDPEVNASSFEVVENPRSDEKGFREFTTYVDMNGLGIYGEDGISEEKMLYVAAIFAELLDNDEDGQWDDPEVVTQLLQSEAMMPVFTREGSDAENEFFRHYDGDGVSAVLYNGEVDPSRPGHWGEDATIEETMHTINHVGHVQVYPTVFGLEPDSSRLTEAMDVARGGQWTSFPDDYPDEAWYHYEDRTCDYECMAIEYIYWAQVSNMGILDDPQTCSGIANEWELCSKELLEEGDVLIYALITDPNQPLPQLAPDGEYTPSSE
jgi:hypothetical protein